ncbi:hypothetical protein O988_09237 [Pseudogymnoascus sp. VKM F-3808]|nr:hypothetical protein O988_09237 [Pseudogymnoascus sp. VKM F-3808]
MASQKPRQSNSDDESTRASHQDAPKATEASLTQPNTDETKNISAVTTTTGEVPPRSWYGGGSWPRIKSNPSIQVVKETIMAGKSGNNSRAAGAALFEQRTPAEAQPSKASPSRPPSMDPGKSKETLKLVPGKSSTDNTTMGNNGTAKTETIPHSAKPTEDQSESTNTVVEPELDNVKLESDAVIEEQKATGWLEWLRPTKVQNSPQRGSATAEDSVPRLDAPQQPPSVNKTKSLDPSGPTVVSDRQENDPTDQQRQPEANSRWQGLWPVSNSSSTVARPEESNSQQEPVKPDLNMGKDNEQSNNATTTGSSWAFWSRQVPSATRQTTNSKELGEIAVTGEPSQEHPVAALSNAPENTKAGPGTPPNQAKLSKAEMPSKTAAVNSASSTKSFAPNLLLPSFRNTYQLAESPSIIQQIARLLFRSQQPPTNHLFVIKDPPKIKKAIAIGIHGLFPAALLRTVIGQPTGTSIKFANHGASAIERWAERHGFQCDIEKIALEGEGKIAERVDHLWKLLLNWVEHVRQADFILVSCHSQGVPVAMMLTAKLINLGVVSSAKIGVCAMAGVSLGPFTDYKSRLFSGSAAELFDFADLDSEVSRSYHESLSVAMKYGVRVTYVGSIDDQLVSLESAVFSPVDHPYIYRSVFVDGRIHAPDFITNLVGFALKLRNLGVSDHQLIKALSAPLAGSLYSGEGHSRLYDEEAIYDLSVQFALETTSVNQNVALKVQRSAANGNSNPFQLPWSMRGLLEEDVVKTELDQEAKELLLQFEEWKPTTKSFLRLLGTRVRVPPVPGGGKPMLRIIIFPTDVTLQRTPKRIIALSGPSILLIPPLEYLIALILLVLVTFLDIYCFGRRPLATLINHMSFWNKNPSSSKQKIRTETVPVKASPGTISRTPSRSQSEARLASSLPRSKSSGQASRSSRKDGYSTKLSLPERSISRKRSPVYQRIESDSSEDESQESPPINKRQRLTPGELDDPTRSLPSRKQFSQIDSTLLIHAADIASYKLGYRAAFGGTDLEEAPVGLQYPGSSIAERYELVFKKDSFDPVEEILGVIKDFTDFFLDDENAKPFVDPDTGIIRRLERARNLGSLEGFKSALQDYNSAVESLRLGKDIASILDKKHGVSESLVVRIMAQTYDRAVSPKVDLLRKYENGTNEIYGELKSNLVYKILAETKITSKQVFVDLGSGVANVVLQAALQVGCESWGCEIMENACSIAEAQKAEFEARCRLWGLQPGLTRLERGDFMVNEDIREALQRADVVLVNNEVFTPELNVSLVNLFLDLKEGCKIVSLKSFVPENRKISNYNNNDPSNILDVAKKAYSTKSVSWKDEGGNYYIATKDSTRLQSYGDRS